MGETYNEYKKYHNDIVMYGMDGDKYYEETKELLKDFSSRTMKLISECDVAVFLPGGDCTIQEIATFNQYNREHPNSHKLILVNINNFYNPLIKQYENIINYELNKDVSFKNNFIIVDKIEDAIKYIL